MSFELSRRRTLGLLASITVPSTAAPVAAAATQSAPNVDDFLASASAAERARYHANALAEVMAELHPDRLWRSHVSHESRFCLVVGDERPAAPVGKEA